jgi:hypothetical protein
LFQCWRHCPTLLRWLLRKTMDAYDMASARVRFRPCCSFLPSLVALLVRIRLNLKGVATFDGLETESACSSVPTAEVHWSAESLPPKALRNMVFHRELTAKSRRWQKRRRLAKAVKPLTLSVHITSSSFCTCLSTL